MNRTESGWASMGVLLVGLLFVMGIAVGSYRLGVADGRHDSELELQQLRTYKQWADKMTAELGWYKAKADQMLKDLGS